MLKRFLKDSAVYGTSAVLARIVGIILLPLYTRALSPADFGISEILVTLITLTGIVLSLELPQAVYRVYPEESSQAEKIRYASSAFWFISAASLVFVLLLLPFSRPLAALILSNSDLWRFVVIALCTLIFANLYNLLIILLRSQFKAVQYGITNLLVTLLSILATIYLVLIARWGVIGVLLGNLVGYAAGFFSALFFCRGSIQVLFSLPKLKEMLQYSSPLVLSSLSLFTNTYINRIFLTLYLNLAVVGLLSIANKIISPIALIINSFSGSITPLIYNQYQAQKTPYEIARIFRIFTLFSLLIVLAVSVFTDEILQVMTTPEYFSAKVAIPPLAFAAAISGLYLFNPGLAIARKTHLIAVINIVSAVFSIAFNFALIPAWGLLGASLASLLTALLNYGLNYYYSQKYYRIPFEWPKILPSLAVVCAAILLSHQQPWNGVPALVLKSGVLAGTLGAFFLFGMVSFKEIHTFRKDMEMFVLGRLRKL